MFIGLLLFSLLYNGNDNHIMNLFSVAVSLFCGIIVALCSVILNAFKRSIKTQIQISREIFEHKKYLDSIYKKKGLVLDANALSNETYKFYIHILNLSEDLTYNKNVLHSIDLLSDFANNLIDLNEKNSKNEEFIPLIEKYIYN